MATTDDIDLDPALYVRAPILDVPAGIALPISLLTAYKKHSKKLNPAVTQAVKTLRRAVVDLQAGWDGQRKAALVSAEDPRPADQLCDRAFAALSRRLEGLMLLPEDLEDAQRAAKLYARLFPTGLLFLKLPYPRQWAECDQRMRDIQTGGIENALRELCGDAVVENLKAAHDNYGRALGITTAKDASPKAPKIAEQLRVVQQAIVDYALQLVAAGRADRELAPIVAACLRPIDELRAADASRGTTTRTGTETPVTPVQPASEPAVTPETPIPPLDDVV